MEEANLKRETLIKVYVPYFIQAEGFKEEDILETIEGRLVISEEQLNQKKEK